MPSHLHLLPAQEDIDFDFGRIPLVYLCQGHAGGWLLLAMVVARIVVYIPSGDHDQRSRVERWPSLLWQKWSLPHEESLCHQW